MAGFLAPPKGAGGWLVADWPAVPISFLVFQQGEMALGHESPYSGGHKVEQVKSEQAGKCVSLLPTAEGPDKLILISLERYHPVSTRPPNIFPRNKVLKLHTMGVGSCRCINKYCGPISSAAELVCDRRPCSRMSVY